jgi:hypothetical protein
MATQSQLNNEAINKLSKIPYIDLKKAQDLLEQIEL